MNSSKREQNHHHNIRNCVWDKQATVNRWITSKHQTLWPQTRVKPYAEITLIYQKDAAADRCNIAGLTYRIYMENTKTKIETNISKNKLQKQNLLSL